MKLPRFVGMVDLGVATVVAVMIFLPAREMYAQSVVKGDDAKQFSIALAEARTMVNPGDGVAVEELGRSLSDAAELLDRHAIARIDHRPRLGERDRKSVV